MSTYISIVVVMFPEKINTNLDNNRESNKYSKLQKKERIYTEMQGKKNENKRKQANRN